VDQNTLNLIILLIPALPLFGFVLHILLRSRISEKLAGLHHTAWVTGSFILSLVLFFHVRQNGGAEAHLFEWFSGGDLHVPFALIADQLSIIMMLVITGIGALIHVYSIGYMHGDDGFNRFFSYLNLFIFFMLILVMANNYVLMFVGWEGVGLCSYLLIGFWFKNQEYNKAASKAFIMNRIGDLAMLLGLFLLFQYAGTLTFEGVAARFNPASPDYFVPDTNTVTAITLLLFVGACGKSAQIPLFTWLPDAMAGPTPVSALIHAATMVTAGIYMIVRSNLMFSEAELTLQIIAVVGIVTSIFAGSIALKQNDIKKVLAYSTVSQLGLMFFAIGVEAYEAAMFHLVTHAFFKALLFLSAGSVIHGMGGEQDIRRMGGLRAYMKVTHWVFGFGVLAIMAVPPFSGFFSKDNILVSAYQVSPLLWALGLFAGLFTAFYMMRLYAVVFQGPPRMSEQVRAHIHESPAVITVPLMILCLLSIAGGLLNVPHLFGGHKAMMHFMENVVPVHEGEISIATEWLLLALGSIAIFTVIFIAHLRYRVRHHVPKDDVAVHGFEKVVGNKYYIDELYEKLIARPMLQLSEFMHKVVDNRIIDGMVQGAAQCTGYLSTQLRFVQTGAVSFYLFAMALGMGVIVLLIYLM